MLFPIKLALTATNYLQGTQVSDTDISVQYDQQAQVKQPKILNQVNCVPLLNGIKSASIHGAGLSALSGLQLGPSTELTTMIDANGNLWYMLLDTTKSTQYTTDIYMRNASDGNGFTKYATITNDNRYEYNLHTVFQNKTLIAGLPDITYHVPLTTVNHPDWMLGDNIPGAFIDADITNGELTAYNLIGIGRDVLDSVQCVTSYQNYMLLFTRNRLYYSCPTDPYDFTPVEAGGGSTAIAEVRGDILAVLPSASGFIIYCRDNIVLGRFTGSTIQPFAFSEIKGSSGLVMRDEEPLLVKNETGQVHFAILVSGLSVISETEVQPLSQELTKFVANDFVEVRKDNTCILQQVNTNINNSTEPKIRRMYSFGTKLFMLIDTAPELEDMLYIYDLVDNSIGIIHGNYKAVAPQLTSAVAGTSLYLQQKVSAIPDSFVLMRADTSTSVVFDVLNLGDKSNILVSEDSVTSEFMLGEVSINPQYTTIVESVKLEGRLTRLIDEEVGYNPLEADRVRVYGYTDYYSKDSLLEFEYNPIDGRYYGNIEGPNVRILVQGDYFYLTGAELRIDRGIML